MKNYSTKDKSYDQVRFDLIINSYVGRKILEEFKNLVLVREKDKKIIRIANKLDIDPKILSMYLVLGKTPDRKHFGHKDLYFGRPDDLGYYIKIRPNTQKKEILRSFDYLQEIFNNPNSVDKEVLGSTKLYDLQKIGVSTYKDVSIENLTSYKESLSFKKRNKLEKIEDQEQISTYLEIEKEMWNLDKSKNANGDEKVNYVGELVKASIERVAGNSLSHVENDIEFDQSLEEKKNYCKNTRDIIRKRYRLPKIRDKNKLLKIIQANDW